MKKISTSLVVAFAVIAFAACSKKKEESAAPPADPNTVGSAGAKPVEPPPPPPPTPLTGTALADKYKSCVAMVNDGKWDDFKKDCVDEKYVGHLAGMPEMSGSDALMTFFKGQKEAFPDWKLTPQIIMVSGRNILAVNLTSGTHEGTMKSPMGDVPATKKKYGMLMFHRVALSDANKATEEWPLSDGMTMMSQLGLAPKGAMPQRPVMDKGLEGAPIVVVTADDAKEKANLETVKKSNDAFNGRKAPDMLALMADNAVESDQAGPKDITGKKAIEKGMKDFLTAFPDAKIGDVNMWAAGDYVVQTGKMEGTNTGNMGKMKKTGKKMTLDFAEVVHLKDGKIQHVWRFYNGMQFAMQLGLVPDPAAAPKAGEAPKAGDPKAADPKAAPAKAGDMKKEKAPAKKADPAADPAKAPAPSE